MQALLKCQKSNFLLIRLLMSSHARHSTGNALRKRHNGSRQGFSLVKALLGMIHITVFLLLSAVALKPFKAMDDFSSFLNVNASLAIVIDEDYVRSHNLDILAAVQTLVDNIARDNLRNGGLNVKYYSWSSVSLKKDFIAALTVTNCARTWNFYKSANTNSILLIAMTDADCPRLPMTNSLMIPLVEKGEEMSQILLDFKVQKALNWRSCVLIFDSSMDEHASRVIKAMSSSGRDFDSTSLYLYTIDESWDMRQLDRSLTEYLRKFTYTKSTQFVVFSSSQHFIVDCARKLDMLNVYNQWLFIQPQGSSLEAIQLLSDSLVDGAHVAFALNATEARCEETIVCSIGEIMLVFIRGLSKVIAAENSQYGNISDEEWEAIRPTKKERQNDILRHIMDHLAQSSECTGCIKWTFHSMLSWKTQISDPDSENNNRFELLDVGYWNSIFGFIANEPLFPHIDHKFRKARLDIITMNNPPWQIIKYDEKRKIVVSTGIVLEILKEVSNKLNFTYNLIDISSLADDRIEVDNETTPYSSTTNNISPQLEYNLQMPSTFMAAVASTIDASQLKPYNFTIPISIQKYSFLFRKPEEVSRIYLFTAPFTLTTWLALAVAILITAPILFVINILVPLEQLKTSGLCKMKNCFWYVYGALLQQGGMYLPMADSGRVLVGIWWIVVIVIVTTYCGNLVAFLTFPKFQPGIKYLHESFEHKDIVHFGLRNGTFFEKYVPISTRNDFKHFLSLATIYNHSNEEDILQIKNGRRINIDWKINLQKIIQDEFESTKECNFVLGTEDFVEEQIGLIVPSNNPYLRKINDELKRLHEIGFIEQCHKVFLPTTDKCNRKATSRQITNHKVNLVDMQGCFLILLFGFSFALIVMAIEFWLHHIRVASSKKVQSFAT